MVLKINNLGLLKETEININGLTVLVGPNKSGKSTISKALYSVIEACNDLSDCRKKDCLRLLSNKFAMCRGSMSFSLREDYSCTELIDFFNYYFSILNDAEKDDFSDAMIIKLHNYIDTIHKQIKDLKFSDIVIENDAFISAENNNFISEVEKKDIFEKDKNSALENINEIKNTINRLSKFNDYAFKVLEEMLNREFCNQIIYKNKDSLEANIFLQNNDFFFDLFYGKDGKLLSKSHFKFPQKFDFNTFYIDNPLIVDEIDHRARMFNYQVELRSVEDKFHKNNLKDILNDKNNLSTEEKIQNIKQLSDLFEYVNKIIPGEIEIKNNRQKFYFDEDFMLNIENLASGMKLFLILKSLLLRNLINKKTIIILDEPDSRLHPEWQNFLAEFIIILMKFTHCKFLLTTHNPNFLLALETYSLKYKNDFSDNFVNYYIANNYKETIFKTFKNESDNLGLLYKSFSDHYAHLLSIREELIKY